MTELVLQRVELVWKRIDPVWLLVLILPLLVGIAHPEGLSNFLSVAISALGHTLPYITIAVVLIGYLSAAGAEGVLAQAFTGRETRMIVFAALLGGIAPFCSCEVIPFVAALLAAGTPLSAVMAFWLSSPLMDPPQFAITTGALGMEYAVAKVIFAVMIGIAGGLVMQALIARGAFVNPLVNQPKSGCCGPSTGCGTGDTLAARPVWRFWTEAPRRAAFVTAGMTNAIFLLKWMSLAYMLESLMLAYVPADWIAGLVGGTGVLPIIVGALVGAPAYLNGYAAPALVSGLIEQGMTPGAAMSFMIAGAVSCIPAMAAVFALVRRPVFAMYVALGLGGAILSGMLFQIFIG